MGRIRNIAGGLIFAFSSLFNSLAFPEERLVWDDVCKVEMISELGKKSEEPVKIEAYMDDEKNRLSLSFYTKNYDRKEWSRLEERIPAYQRYTQINHMSTRVIAIYPSNVEINLIKQSAYVIPQHELEELSPMEEHPYMQFLFELAQKGLDLIVKDIGFKGAPKALDKIVKSVENREERYVKEMEGDFPRNYVAEEIVAFPVLPGRTETARNYEIFFITGVTKKDIPVYLTIKLGLGNPSVSSTGTMNKYGELEGLLISFKLNPTNKEVPKIVNKSEENSKEESTSVQAAETSATTETAKLFENYFPTGKELERISARRMEVLAHHHYINDYIQISNPIIFSPEKTRRMEPNMPDLIQKGIASYGILNDNGVLDEIGFYMEVYQFKNSIPKEMTVKTGYNSDLVIFGMKAGSTYINFDSLIKYDKGENKSPSEKFDYNKIASKKQVLNYLDFLIEYAKRIDGKMIIEGDKKGLATTFNKNPEKLKDMINNPEKHGLYSAEEAINYLFTPCYE